MDEKEATENIQVNGTVESPAVVDQLTNGKSSMEFPMAKLEEIVITDYVRESLDKVAKNEGFQNYDFVVDHGSSIGDGFVGIMMKVSIKEIDSDKSLVVLVKIPPKNQARREQMKIMPLFEREVFVYNVLLPEFVEFQKERKISQANGFFDFPKVYFADFDKEKDDSIIIMDDLRESGHKMWDKYKPIDFEHAKLLMTSLGRLHALSFAMKARKPELMEKYKKLTDYFRDGLNDAGFATYMEEGIKKAIESLDPNDVKSRTKTSKLVSCLTGDMFDCMDLQHIEPYGVVNHGDCWINNYLFNYAKNGTPKNIVLIDWQIARYCSPVVDLVYFIFICTDHELRVKHYDELLSIYHHSLKQLLDHMGGDTMSQFPFTALLRHLKRYGKFGIIMACMVLPLIQCKAEEYYDMDFMAEKMTENNPAEMEEMMKKFMEASGNEKAKPRMRDVFLDAIRYGYL